MTTTRDAFSAVHLTDREILSARHALERLVSDHGTHADGVVGEMLRQSRQAFLSCRTSGERREASATKYTGGVLPPTAP